MIKDRIVRIKLKKQYHGHRPLSYVGKVTAFSDDWVVMDAKGVMLSRAEKSGVQIDEKTSAMLIPRDNIESIRVLPDSFDMKELRVSTQGQQIRLVVDKALDVYIGELGEG